MKRGAREVIQELRNVAARHNSFEVNGFEGNLAKKQNDEFARLQKTMQGTQLPTTVNAPGSGPTPGNIESAAQFTLQIKRETANIAAALPVMLFNPIELQNGYRRALQGYIPAGVTLGKVSFGEPDGEPDTVRFKFTGDGGATDDVTIKCTSVPYPSFLQALITDRFDLDKIRITLSDPAQIAQYAQEVNFVTKSMFGLGSQNPVVPDNFRTPQQYQAGIVDVDVTVKFDKQTGVIIPIIPVANLQVSINCFSPRFYQHSARGW